MRWPWERGTQRVSSTRLDGRYYVYLLRFPNVPEVFGVFAGRAFYVGKGTGDRLLAHEKETRLLLSRNKMMLLKHKHKTIIAIWDAGYDVVQQVVYRTDDEEQAYLAEAAEIRRHGLEHLTNATYGHKPKTKKAPHPFFG